MDYKSYNKSIICDEQIVDLSFNLREELKNNLPQCLNIDNIIEQQDIDFCNNIIQKHKNFIIVGMGGSSLNPKMIHSISKNKDVLSFIDFLDKEKIDTIFKNKNISDTCVIFISKSGDSVEVIEIYKYISELFSLSNVDISQNFYMITDINGKLYNNFKNDNIKIIPHSTNIGGRFSGFSNIAYLTAKICNVNFEKYQLSAKNTLNNFINNGCENILNKVSFLTSNIPIITLINYNSQLLPFIEWYSQMIAESLGKDSKGITPIINNAPMDYHSQLQLHLNGPKNKIFSLIKINGSSDNNLNNLLEKQYNLLVNVLNELSVNFETIKLEILNEEILAKLIIETIISILLASKIQNTNPYDQPAVTKLKYSIK
jgi:glucose-6-phosphate isomerase